MVQSRDRWEESAGRRREGSSALIRRIRPLDDLVEEGRLELFHVRRLLDDLTSSRFSGELDSWSQRRYDALCSLERELLGLQA